MKNTALMLAAALLAACAMPQSGTYGGLGAKKGFGFGAKRAASAPEAQTGYIVESVDILTEPPGAVIHINGAAAGNSPVSAAPVLRYWRGPAGAMVLDTVKVEAFPTAAGQCVQSVILGQNNTKAASPVRLVMTNCAPAPQTK